MLSIVNCFICGWVRTKSFLNNIIIIILKLLEENVLSDLKLQKRTSNFFVCFSVLFSQCSGIRNSEVDSIRFEVY